MTLLERVLNKAYVRRLADRAPLPGRDEDLVTRGWVARLREPLHAPVAPQDVEVVEPGECSWVDSPQAAHAAAWAWPPICERLLQSEAGAGFLGIARLLRDLPAQRGVHCVALTGPHRRSGRTSVVLTLARVLSEISETGADGVLLIDADFGNPELARRLGIEPGPGLWEAALEEASLATACATMVPGRLGLLPLAGRRAAGEVDEEKAAALRRVLRECRERFSLVLIDAGPWESLIPPVLFESGVVDALIAVCRYDDALQNPPLELLAQAGVDLLGIIETFAPRLAGPGLASGG